MGALNTPREPLVVEDELLHLLELGGDLVALLALKEGVAGCRFEQRVLYLSNRD